MSQNPSFQQKQKLTKDVGSLMNWIYANNSTTAKVGEYFNELLYTDRRCYKVVEVSKDLRTVKVEWLEARAKAGSTMGHQDWEMIETAQYSMLKWRYNNWYLGASKVRGFFSETPRYYYDWEF